MFPRRTYTTITLTMLLVSGTVWTLIAMLWIHGLSLRYPAPFIGMPGRCWFLEIKIFSDMEVAPSYKLLTLIAIHGNIQGGFFYCSALKMTKCQTHWKI